MFLTCDMTLTKPTMNKHYQINNIPNSLPTKCHKIYNTM